MDTKTREVVLTTLLDIEKNHTFSNIALGTALRANQFMSKQDRAYITRMVEGVTEQRIKLDYIINQFSKTKSSGWELTSCSLWTLFRIRLPATCR